MEESRISSSSHVPLVPLSQCVSEPCSPTRRWTRRAWPCCSATSRISSSKVCLPPPPPQPRGTQPCHVPASSPQMSPCSRISAAGRVSSKQMPWNRFPGIFFSSSGCRTQSGLRWSSSVVECTDTAFTDDSQPGETLKTRPRLFCLPIYIIMNASSIVQIQRNP